MYIRSEYTYFYISKNITSYTFLLVFKIVESLQCILNNSVQSRMTNISRNVCTVMIFRNIEISYYVREKVLIILTLSLSMSKILSVSIKVILSVDKTLSERNGVTVFRNLLFFLLRLL